MKLSKIAALLMLPVLALTLAACSAPKGDAKDATSGDAQIAELIAQKPSSAEEAAELYQQLLQKENEIFASDNALWEKVFLAANKDTPMIEDGKNYGDFLLDTIEGAKDQFAADELKTLKAGRAAGQGDRGQAHGAGEGVPRMRQHARRGGERRCLDRRHDQRRERGDEVSQL